MAEGPLLVVSSYSRFDNLAHGPRGSEAEHSLRVFRLDASTGTLSLQTAVGRDVMNPAFSRKHPEKNIVYACTETVEDNGEVVAYNVCNETGRMSQLGGPVDAGGSSTCYLTIDPTQRWMLVCNYWNSLLCSLPIDPSTGLRRNAIFTILKLPLMPPTRTSYLVEALSMASKARPRMPLTGKWRFNSLALSPSSASFSESPVSSFPAMASF